MSRLLFGPKIHFRLLQILKKNFKIAHFGTQIKPEQVRNLGCKTCVVTGGSEGIGFAIAHQLLQEKARNVALIGIDTCIGREAVNTLNCAHGAKKAFFVNSDVQCPTRLKEAFNTIAEEYGRIDIVVNSAGICDARNWEQEVTTNFMGTINTILVAYKFMSCQKESGDISLILNVSGTHGLQPLSAAPILSGCLHAVVGLSRSFGADQTCEKTGVEIFALCPGITQTKFIKDAHLKGLDEKMGYNLENEFNKSTKQKPEVCGKAAVHVLKHGETGSVWAIEGGKLFLLKIPQWRSYGVLLAQYL